MQSLLPDGRVDDLAILSNSFPRCTFECCASAGIPAGFQRYFSQDIDASIDVHGLVIYDHNGRFIEDDDDDDDTAETAGASNSLVYQKYVSKWVGCLVDRSLTYRMCYP